jgi:hypothetical protein
MLLEDSAVIDSSQMKDCESESESKSKSTSGSGAESQIEKLV